MAAPRVQWKEGRGWTAAVAGAVRIPAVPYVLWALPGLAACGLAWAWTNGEFWGMAAAVLSLIVMLVAVLRFGAIRSQSPEYLAAARTADAYAASQPMRLAWDNLRRALDSLGWYRDIETLRQVPTGKTDEQGQPITVERKEQVREYPPVSLASEDPANEVRLYVGTTSGLLTMSAASAKATDLDDFLGLNGWPVEVSPAEPGTIEIRMARTLGRDLYGR